MRRAGAVRPGRKEIAMMTGFRFEKILAAVLVLSATSPALSAEVDRREANQQGRIAQGVRSGELTPRETARLERQEARIHREIRRERAANGGALTPAERARVNRQQDRLSRRIYRAKHDGRTM
jgi:hypothetical protein